MSGKKGEIEAEQLEDNLLYSSKATEHGTEQRKWTYLYMPAENMQLHLRAIHSLLVVGFIFDKSLLYVL